MKPWKGWAGLSLVGILWAFGVGANTAKAGWNNVFQVTCRDCRRSAPIISQFVAPPVVAYSNPCDPCCEPQATISYQQRCYYEPVTTYRTETYYEPRVTYQRSYYYEPVQSYRYATYYDPCTGCSQQISIPQTCYRLRSRCDAVTAYVQRCRLVPVQSYRISYYMQPVVTYSNPCCDTVGVAPVSPAPITPQPPLAGTPGSADGQGRPNTLPPQGIPPATGNYQPSITEDYSRSGVGGGLIPRQDLNAVPRPFQGAPPPNAPLNRVTSLGSRSALVGAVVGDDRQTPRRNAVLLFVSTQKNGAQVPIQADAAGRFSVNLPAGDWLMYVADPGHKPVYHSRLTLQEAQVRNVLVAAR